MSDSPRNVLFVVLDTVRKDHLTPYGYDRDTTPGLAAFADEATVFDQAVAPAPWTLPVHASIFTGLYPSTHGADQETPYLEGVTTLAQQLNAAGYDTACYSSNAWITPYTRLTAGFEHQDNFFQAMPGDLFAENLATVWQYMNDSPRLRSVADKLVSLGNVAHEYFASGGGGDSKTPAVLERTRSFIEDVDESAPAVNANGSTSKPDDTGWFAFVNLMDAHLPYYPPEPYRKQFAPDVDPTAVCQNSKEYNCGGRDIDEDEWDAIRGLYDAEIAHMDAQLAELFDWLRATDRWDDTTVIVCADHGELHGEQDLFGHEFGLYDPLINVPLLIKDPDLEPTRRTDQVELLDLYHTVLDVAGLTPGDESAADESAEESPVPARRADEHGAVRFDPTRSFLREEYRTFTAVDSPDPGQQSCIDREHEGDTSPYAFVEYAQPVIELNQLEEKAKKFGVDLDEQSRYYARMRAARRPDGKYVRRDRVPDESIELGETFADETVREVRDEVDLDGGHLEVARALVAFERAVGGAWTGAEDAPGAGTEGLEAFDDAAQDRLRDLGYLE